MAIGVTSLRGYQFEDRWLPFNISGAPTSADVGKAVELDTSAANTVKLATDGGRILGRLETVETRTVEGITVGTVSLNFADSFPILSGETFAVGDTAVGGGSGTVRVRKVSTTDTPDFAQNTVVEVGTDGTVVILKV